MLRLLLIILSFSLVTGVYLGCKSSSPKGIVLDVNVKLISILDRTGQAEVQPFYNMGEISNSLIQIGDSSGELTPVDIVELNVSKEQAYQYRDRFLLKFNSQEWRLKSMTVAYKELSDGLIIEQDYIATHSSSEIANAISSHGFDVRIVSGIELIFDELKTPQCWVQFKEKNETNWITLNPNNKTVLPLKDFADGSKPEADDCVSILINSWGKRVTELEVKISNS